MAKKISKIEEKKELKRKNINKKGIALAVLVFLLMLGIVVGTKPSASQMPSGEPVTKVPEKEEVEEEKVEEVEEVVKENTTPKTSTKSTTQPINVADNTQKEKKSKVVENNNEALLVVETTKKFPNFTFGTYMSAETFGVAVKKGNEDVTATCVITFSSLKKEEGAQDVTITANCGSNGIASRVATVNVMIAAPVAPASVKSTSTSSANTCEAGTSFNVNGTLYIAKNCEDANLPVDARGVLPNGATATANGFILGGIEYYAK